MVFRNILFILTICIFKLEAQENVELGTRIILNTNSFSNAAYHEYKPFFKATAIYQNLEEVTNEYPEQLMSSILCASSQDWENYNTLGGEETAEKKSEKEFADLRKINIKKTYFELHSKLTFTVNDSEMAIIKFYLYEEHIDKPVAGALVMKKVEGRWYKTSTPYTTNLAMILTIFKADVLGRVLNNNPQNSIEQNICDKVLTNRGLDCEKVLTYNYSEEEKVYLSNPLNW